ncbi:MAG: M48 family metallopeptidase [Thermodesulfovibrionales bacterium]
MDIYLIIIFFIYILIALFNYWLDHLNISHLKKFGSTIPPEFEDHIDQSLLDKMKDYTVENTRFGIISSIINNIILIIFIFGGILNAYNSWVASMGLSFILSGLVFFLLMTYAETVIGIPFSIYRTFKIEKKYGFNTMTPKLWITDTIKSLLLSTIMLSLLIAGGLWIFRKSPDLWWFWIWCFFFAFSLFLMYISPYVLEPLFNKFVPVGDEELEGDINILMQKVGIKVSRVFKMDASKRSTHTNAYFSGIGKVKRIVLFDTLIQQLSKSEILSVLAHEAGHWKKKHILKFIIVTEIIALIAFYVSFHLLQSDLLIDLFNINDSTLFTKIILLGFLGSIVLFPFTPIIHSLSRKHERQADDYSFDLTGDNESMITSLVKLSKDNLSNLNPHPLYASFHYSHPPVLERIRRLKDKKT